MIKISSGFSIVCIFVGMVDVCAGESHLTVGKSQTSPPRLEKRLSDLKVESDHSSAKGFQYAMPNERLNYVLEPSLEDPEGILVSVGTFRGFDLASSGRVSGLVLLDYNKDIRAFNDLCTKLILRSKDRFEFLSLLLTGERQESLIASAKVGDLDLPSFAKALLKAKASPLSLVDRYKKLGVSFDSETELSLKSETGGSLKWALDKMPNVLAKFSSRKGALENTILGNDLRFERIVRMVREGRVLTLQGDLLEGKAMQKLGDRMRENNMRVSAVDVSNVPQYFSYVRNNGKAAGLFEKMRARFESLPLTDRAKLFMTSQHLSRATEKEGLKPSDSWSYVVVPKGGLGGLGDAFRKIDALPEGTDREAVLTEELRSRFRRSSDDGPGNVLYLPAK